MIGALLKWKRSRFSTKCQQWSVVAFAFTLLFWCRFDAVESQQPGVCSLPSGTTTVQGTTIAQALTPDELKNVIACANENSDKRYRVELPGDIQLNSKWECSSFQCSGLYIEDDANLEIVGTKPGGSQTQISGQNSGSKVRKQPLFSVELNLRAVPNRHWGVPHHQDSKSKRSFAQP